MFNPVCSFPSFGCVVVGESESVRFEGESQRKVVSLLMKPLVLSWTGLRFDNVRRKVSVSCFCLASSREYKVLTIVKLGTG